MRMRLIWGKGLHWDEGLTPEERERRNLVGNFGCVPASTLRWTLDALHTRPFAFLYTYGKLAQFVNRPGQPCELPRRIPAFNSKEKQLVARILVRAKDEIVKCAEYWDKRVVPTSQNTWPENIPAFPADDEEKRRAVARWFGAIAINTGDIAPYRLFTRLDRWEDCLVVLARECSFFGQPPDCLPVLEERLSKIPEAAHRNWVEFGSSYFAKHRLTVGEAWWNYCVVHGLILDNPFPDYETGEWHYSSRHTGRHKSAPVFRYARKPPISSRVNPLLNSEK